MLCKSVPPFVARMREMAELFGAEQPEIDRMADALTDIIRQFYIKTATWSLDDWEDEFGLQRNPVLSGSQRRARLLAKLNSNPPATVRMLENLVLQVMSADQVKIVEHPEEYCFDIYVNTEQLVDAFDIADDAVYAARPAHLNYKFINLLIRRASAGLYMGIAGGYICIVRGVVEDAVLPD